MPVPHGFYETQRRAKTGASRRAPTNTVVHPEPVFWGMPLPVAAGGSPAHAKRHGRGWDRLAAPSPTRHEACEKSKPRAALPSPGRERVSRRAASSVCLWHLMEGAKGRCSGGGFDFKKLAISPAKRGAPAIQAIESWLRRGRSQKARKLRTERLPKMRAA
jgi:hypothetical protein